MPLTALFFALCSTAPVLDASGRPVLSGPEQVHLSADGRFRVHWTTSGVDAVTSVADVDPANGVPDIVDWVEEGAGRMYAAFVDEDGWPAPRPDDGVGGDDRVDYYLRELDGNGCTHEVTLPSGTRASYVEIAPARASNGKIPFESIAGHELHHVLELRLTDAMPNWIAEATATYAQYLLFSDDGGALDALRQILWHLRIGQPQRALDAVGLDYEYAGMVWVKYLVDKGGTDRRKLLALWQALAAAGDVDAGHDAYAAAHLGLRSLDEAAADHAVWNWFACSNDDGRHYDARTAGCDYGSVAVVDAAPLPADGTSGAVERRGSAYLRILPDCRTDELDVTVRPTGPVRFQLIQEQIEGDSPVAGADGTAGVDTAFTVKGWNQYRRLGLVATSLGAAPATFAYHVSARGDAIADLPPAAQLALVPQTLALQAGASAAVELTASYGSCSDGTGASAAAEWRSSAPEVASVAAGRVVAHRSGSAEVYAVIGSVASNPLTVTVTETAATGGCAVGNRRSGPLGALWVLLLFVGMIRLSAHT